MSANRTDEAIQGLSEFFASASAVRAMRPLANGIRVALVVGGTKPLLLTKRDGVPALLPVATAPTDVEFALDVPLEAAEKLATLGESDVPSIAVALVELLSDPDDERRVRARVYAGLFELLRKGYLSVIPLGGTPLMRALGARGIGSLSEIRERLKRLKENR